MRTLPRAATACRWDSVSESFWVRDGSMRAEILATDGHG
jgi:hypothetical protein